MSKCVIVKEEYLDKEIVSYDRFHPTLYWYMHKQIVVINYSDCNSIFSRRF